MKILGVKIDDVDIGQAVHRVEGWLEGNKPKIFAIVTPNPEIIVQAQDDPRLRKIINEADLAVPDGVGVVWASGISLKFKVQSAKLKAAVAGVELMRRLCEEAARKGWVVGLYGGRGGAAETALARLKRKHVGLEGWSREPGEIDVSQLSIHVDRKLRQIGDAGLSKKSQSDIHVDARVRQDGKEKRGEKRVREERRVVEDEISWVASKIAKTKTRLLFVGLGAPKQEFFMEKLLLEARGSRLKGMSIKHKNKKTTSNLILMAVGGAFDELAGKSRPAPEWVRRAGLKWLWRLVWEPWRLRRQVRLAVFAWLMMKSILEMWKRFLLPLPAKD